MDDLRLARRSEDTLCLADIERQRLFAKEMLARLRCGEGDFCLESRWNGQREGVNVRVSYQFAPISCGFGYAQLPSNFSGVFQGEGTNSAHFAVRGGLKRGDMPLLAKAGAYNADDDRTRHQTLAFESPRPERKKLQMSKTGLPRKLAFA